MDSFLHFVLNARFRVLFVLFILVAVIGSGASKLTFNTDYHGFFDKGNPELAAFDAIQRQFVKSDTVMIMVSSEDVVFNKKAVEAIWQLTEQSWKIPYSSRVDSLSNFQLSVGLEDDLQVNDLIPTDLKLTSKELTLIKEQALNEPDLLHRLLSEDAKNTAIYITLNLPKIGDQAQANEVMTAVRAMVNKTREDFPALKLYVSGVVPMDYAFAEVSMQDGQQLIPFSFFVMMLVLYLIFRSIIAVTATLLVVVLSIVMAMGTAGWLGIALTPPSASAPLLILTLAIADCIHYIASYHKACHDKLTQNKALQFAFKSNVVPIILTSLTSAIGFLGMNYSDSPPFRDLGNITAIGIVYACLLSLVLVPIFLSFFKAPTKFSSSMLLFDKLLHRLSIKISLHPKKTLFYGGVIVACLVAFVPSNKIDDTFIHYFDQSIQFRVDSDAIEKELTGLYFIDYAIDSNKANGIYNTEFLADTERFITWLETKPEVKHVSSLLNVLKRLNKNLHGDDASFYALPKSSNEAAQYIFLYEMSLPYGLDLKNLMSFDKSALRVSVTLSTIPTQQVLEFERQVKQWWTQNSDIKVSSGSPTLMFAHIGVRNIHSMLIGTGVALFAISILMLIVLRSVKYGLFSLLPNIAPALMAFGVWGLLVGEVGLAVSVVAAMSLGIVVDDTIHFLYKCLRLRRQGIPIGIAVEKTIRETGTAIVTTSLILGLGFGILAMSHFQVNAQMGLLTAVCILLAVLLDLIVLPALLLVGDKSKLVGKVEQFNTNEVPERLS